MKIVLINAVYGVGSTGRSYKELQEFLISQGHECIVVYGNQKGKYDNAFYMGNLIDHKFHALASRITGNAGCYSTIATKKLLKILDEYKPDVVHLGNLHGNFIKIPMLLNYLADKNIATTVTLHDCYFFTGGCVHYTLNRCYRWQDSCGNCKFRKSLNSWFFDKSKKLLDYKKKAFNRISKLGVIGVSQWIADEARKSPVFKNAKEIIKIHDWVDLNIFKFTDSNIKKILQIEDKKMILGVASGWGESKGLQDFIALSKLISNDTVIVLVGKMSDNITLPQNIISVSATNNVEELVEYYSAADVFVQLSLQETFGKVVAEAISCGTPAVVYNSTASPELVEDGCGISVDVERGIKGIFVAIEKVLNTGKEYYSALCRKSATNRFEKENCCEKYLGLWNNLIN